MTSDCSSAYAADAGGQHRERHLIVRPPRTVHARPLLRNGINIPLQHTVAE